jgi:uncharacterized protein
MTSLLYHLVPALESAGDFVSLEGDLPDEHLRLGRTEYSLPSGISYRVDLSHADTGIVASGKALATLIGACARCLEPTTFSVEGEIEGYFVFEGEDHPSDLDDDEFEAVTPEGTIELADIIRAAIIFEIPPVLLCDEGCRGLCPHCGANLNIVTCSCNDAPDEDNPFSVLGNLDFPS